MTIPETRTSSDDLSHGHERGASSAFDPVLRHPSSGISVLIVGSGVGGLTAAVCMLLEEKSIFQIIL